MEKKLELIMKNDAGTKKTLIVTSPRDNVTKEEAAAAMQIIVDSGVFEAGGAPITQAVEARYRSVETEELA